MLIFPGTAVITHVFWATKRSARCCSSFLFKRMSDSTLTISVQVCKDHEHIYTKI